jgi:hypothetical protein
MGRIDRIILKNKNPANPVHPVKFNFFWNRR